VTSGSLLAPAIAFKNWSIGAGSDFGRSVQCLRLSLSAIFWLR